MNQELLTFEDLKNKNGFDWWWARDLMQALGYENKWDLFEKIIDKAVKACMSLDSVKYYDNFIAYTRKLDGIDSQDFKLSRFACYLIVMNGDSNIIQVAQAQTYFASQIEILLQAQDIERIGIRQDLKEGQKYLSSIFKNKGGIDYARFNNAGLIGMYNSSNWELAKKRKINKEKLYEQMGKLELSANLFRVNLTEEKIKNDNSIYGQKNLEQAHYSVGKDVRNMVKKQTDKTPEQLPQEKKQILEIESELKQSYRKLSKSKSKKKNNDK